MYPKQCQKSTKPTDDYTNNPQTHTRTHTHTMTNTTNYNYNNTNNTTSSSSLDIESQQQQQQQQQHIIKTYSSHSNIAAQCCMPCNANMSAEYLDTSLPIILPTDVPVRGQFYIDSYSTGPIDSFVWNCTFGTDVETNGTWFNNSDQAGTIMATLVWFLMLYSMATISLLGSTGGVPVVLSMIYSSFVCMALACHAKTSLTDPGSVPKASVPVESERKTNLSHSMCGQCQTYKPPMSHHCRICNRCVSRMDHHCPWMNNCVGAGNLKHFFLFLIYTWASSAYALCLFGWNYFMCATEDCTYHYVLVHLVRVMTVLCVGAFLFTSSMLMNVLYGVMTGIGTIDRLKKKATNTMAQSDEEAIPLTDIFGIGGYYTWPFPVDPIFEDYDRVMGYSMPQRLVREQNVLDRIQLQQENS